MLPTISNKITKREKEIIWAVSHGMSSSEISEKFFISVLTVKTHRRNVMNKVNAKNMAHLVRKSYEMGLLDHVSYLEDDNYPTHFRIQRVS